MAVETAQGREAALQALEKRREKNRSRKSVDNSKQYAGSPMSFDCLGCNAEILVPEGYTDRPKFCDECQAMRGCGWLE